MDSVDEALKESLTINITKLEHIQKRGKTKAPIIPDKRPIIEAELTKLKNQKAKIYDLLEQGIYSTEDFLERSAAVADKIKNCEAELTALTSAAPAQKLPDAELLVRLKKVMAEFDDATPETKNKLLKSVIRRIDYSKTKRQCRNDMTTDLQLNIDFL